MHIGPTATCGKKHLTGAVFRALVKKVRQFVTYFGAFDKQIKNSYI